jgi:predicted AAA+ superfamily ATPase
MDNFWEKPGWEENDRHLAALGEAPFRRPFRQLPPGAGLFVIRGPRQVGKSCWLKTILASEPADRISYISCENIADYKELAEILKALYSRSILLFDEITFVKEWWRAIKHKLDADRRVRIILTGSHSFDIAQGMDQMPGRWGKGGEFLLLPMDFSEVSAMRAQAGWKSAGRIPDLEIYFRVGGFPTAVIESGEFGKSPIDAMDTYQRWLLGDFIQAGKNAQYLREILAQLAITTTSTISLQKVAQRTQIGSHNTAQNYIEMLEACFALKTLYALDPNTGSPRFRKEKKFYFQDPLIYWIALRWAGLEPPRNFNDQLAETVAHEHLSRKCQRMGYYSDSKGEVDFYAHQRWALEVKWKEIPDNLSATYKNLLCPEKIVWTKGNFLSEWPRELNSNT